MFSSGTSLALAKRRLAEEYDAAQERGEVAGHGGERSGRERSPLSATVTDLDRTRKQVHEARQIRAAEAVAPGVVRRTLDERLAQTWTCRSALRAYLEMCLIHEVRMSDNLIPAEHAEFFWNGEPGKAPHEFVVMDIRDRQKQREETGRDPSQQYDSSMGSHVMDWLTGDGPHDHPEGLFITEWVERGADRKTVKEALREIGKIDRCEWARLMYNALDFYDRRSEDN